MIDLGRPALHGEGLTLFPDHADPVRYHYLPDRPRLRLAADGTPELSLLKYRLDPALHAALGGGLLSLTVDLAVEEAQLERARGKLAARFRLPSAARLSPVQADGGTCRLVLIDQASAPPDAPGAAAGSGLVERILCAANPSLYGTNAATFMAVLSAEGASLVEAALHGGGLPAGVVYTLQATGIRPALRAVITARWSDIYHYYENRLHGGKLLLATDIGATIEELAHAEAITIAVDELVPPDERSAVADRALAQAQAYVLEEFFRPTLGQAPPPEDTTADGLATIGQAIKDIAGFFSITYSLREVDRRELKTFRYELGIARAERLTLAPQGALTVLAGSGADRLVVTVEPVAAAEMAFDVGVALPLDTEGIEHIEVTLRYGDRAEALLLDPATPRRSVSFWFRPELGPAVTFGYRVAFRADAPGRTSALEMPARSTETRVIRLNPRELYQTVACHAVAQGLPFDRYPSVILDLELRDPAASWTETATLLLDAAHPEATFSLRVERDSVPRLRRRLRYIDRQGSETVLDWDETEPGILVVGDPLPAVVDVQILGSARFGAVVRRIIVELRPRLDPTRVATRILTAEQPAASWSFAAPAGSDAGYDYRVTLHTALNEVRSGNWLAGPPGKLIVGEGIARLRQVELLLLGRSLAELGLLALKLRFAFEDREAGLLAEEEMLVQDLRAPVRWSYPVADARRQTYTYQLTFIRDTGAVEPQPPVSTSDLLVVRPLP